MRIDVHNDRPPHVSRRDPVVAREGVFAILEVDELSAGERMRIETAAQKQVALPTKSRLWTPRAILKRLVKLYDRFHKPG